MEELLELKSYIENRNYVAAMDLIGEMEEMSREDKIHKIGSFIEILLIHLIKQQAEQRSTRSWEVSIENSIDNINDVNKRRKTGGCYVDKNQLTEIIDERCQRALRRASLEAFEGQFDDAGLSQKIDEALIKQKALGLILAKQAN